MQPPVPHMHKHFAWCQYPQEAEERQGRSGDTCPPPAHGMSVFLLNRDRTLDGMQVALRHEYKWAWNLCCAHERSHKLWEGEPHSLLDLFCLGFKISSDSLDSMRAPRGLLLWQYYNTCVCSNMYMSQ